MNVLNKRSPYLELMLDKYYEERGRDLETGLSTREKLEQPRLRAVLKARPHFHNSIVTVTKALSNKPRRLRPLPDGVDSLPRFLDVTNEKDMIRFHCIF